MSIIAIIVSMVLILPEFIRTLSVEGLVAMDVERCKVSPESLTNAAPQPPPFQGRWPARNNAVPEADPIFDQLRPLFKM